MRRYLVRRFLFAIFTLWGVTVLVFVLSRLGPDPLLAFVRDDTYGLAADTVAELREKWGLDRPVYIQYLVWLGNMLRGDMGESIATQRSVSQTILEALPNTLQLAAVAWVLGTIPGVLLGVSSAIRRGSVIDYFGRAIALIGQATPAFWLAILCILLFAGYLQWLPSATKAPPTESLITQARYFIMPAFVLAFDPWATYLRLTRSSMLEVLDSEYVKLARAKGARGASVIWRHALRNALIQPVTVSALVLAAFMTGSVFVEAVFAWPGIGRLAVQGALDNDAPIVAGTTLIFGVGYVAMNFIADMLYLVIDPRIRYS